MDLMLNQTNKIGVYNIPTILISFYSNKIGVYIMRQIKKLTWLQACFLGGWELYDVTLLVIVSFKFYVMNFVEIVIDFYLHMIGHKLNDPLW